MKKNLGVLGFAAATVALVAYAYFFEFKKRQIDEELKEKDALVVKFEKSDISKISLEGKFSLERDAEHSEKWKVVGPVRDDADETQVSAFLDLLVREKAEMEITDEVMDAKVYGLDKPSGTLTLETRDGKKSKVSVGGEAIQGKQYLRLNETNAVVVSSSQWKFFAEKSLEDLRSKNIFRGGEVESIEIEIPNQSRLRLLKKDGSWILENSKIVVDKFVVQAFLTQLNNLRALSIESEDQKSLGKFNLDHPDAILRVMHKLNKDPDVIRVASRGQEGFVASSDLAPIYKIPQAQVKSLTKKPSDFRDREEAFRFELSQVVGVRTKSPQYDYRFIKKGESWYLEKPDENKDVDHAQVIALLNALQGARVHEYLERRTPFQSQRNITLLDKDGNELLRIDIGPEDKLARRLLKSSRVEEIFAVDSVLVDSWPGRSLVKDKAKPKGS